MTILNWGISNIIYHPQNSCVCWMNSLPASVLWKSSPDVQQSSGPQRPVVPTVSNILETHLRQTVSSGRQTFSSVWAKRWPKSEGSLREHQ